MNDYRYEEAETASDETDEDSYFEDDDGTDATSHNETPYNEDAVAVDWAELEGALENNAPDLHSFLNKKSGDVIRIFSNSMASEQRLQDVEANPEYVYIEPISSREQYRWMEEFIEEMDECPLKDNLLSAVDGKGAFRRFKDALMADSAQRERWFEKRSKKLGIHIEQWLQAKNIIARGRYPAEATGAHKRFETVKRNRYGASDTRNFGKSHRRKAHELVDLVPSKELFMVVTFLEFIQSRQATSGGRS